MRLRRTGWPALALTLAIGAFSGSPVGIASAAPSLPAIEGQAMCVTCKIPLNVAESPQADRERKFIASLIAAGQSEAQIKRALVTQYGPSVLALPSAHGFDLAAYLVPLAALLGLLIALALLLPRWRRRARGPAVGSGPSSLNAGDAARLNADMARFD
jgi:cytochrome c-type biogenesis protein CcmH